jgi:hypothetical protein
MLTSTHAANIKQNTIVAWHSLSEGHWALWERENVWNNARNGVANKLKHKKKKAQRKIEKSREREGGNGLSRKVRVPHVVQGGMSGFISRIRWRLGRLVRS